MPTCRESGEHTGGQLTIFTNIPSSSASLMLLFNHALRILLSSEGYGECKDKPFRRGGKAGRDEVRGEGKCGAAGGGKCGRGVVWEEGIPWTVNSSLTKREELLLRVVFALP